MSRIAIVGYMVGSESVSILRDTINEQYPTNPARVLRQESSQFRGRANDIILNWGSSRAINAQVLGQATLLNKPSAINTASNKINAFAAMDEHNVPTVKNTTDRSVAAAWLDEGHHVFCRTELRGHSGEGIVCVATEEPDDLGNVEFANSLPTAPLYTQGVTGLHREFRVHVFKGKIIFIQQKRRASGFRDNADYSNVVRNHGNGWIYAHNNMATPNDKCLAAAVKAVEAVGLDFGAVDVLTHQQDAWVLEVNTAPGQTGQTTREKYVAAIKSVYEGEEVEALVATPEFDFSPASVAPQPTETITMDLETMPLRGTPIDIIEAANTVISGVISETVQVVIVPESYSDFTIGDVVRLRPASPFYTVSGTDANPVNLDGEVTGIITSDMYGIKVRWPQCPRNCYRPSDLIIIREEILVTPALQHAPTTAQGSDPVVQPTTATTSTTLTPVNNSFYKAIVSGENTVVQYSGDVTAFYMCGFDMLLQCDQVTLIEEVRF